MTMSKLTLMVPTEIVAMAEEQARRENTSISAMFVNFVKAKNYISAEQRAHSEIAPITKSLTGIVKLPEDFDERDFMTDILSEKHGLCK